jgi:catechol 2,3-dioxygenase-like lactoylglutathione lyase family enzyme
MGASGPIHHVSLEISSQEIDAATAFWAILGFRQTETPSGIGDRAVWLARGSAQVHLMLSEQPVVPPSAHLAITLGAAYEPICSALDRAGHTVQARAQHWGSPRAFVRSPGGHRVEIMRDPPPPPRDPRQ